MLPQPISDPVSHINPAHPDTKEHHNLCPGCIKLMSTRARTENAHLKKMKQVRWVFSLGVMAWGLPAPAFAIQLHMGNEGIIVHQLAICFCFPWWG